MPRRLNRNGVIRAKMNCAGAKFWIESLRAILEFAEEVTVEVRIQFKVLVTPVLNSDLFATGVVVTKINSEF